MRLLLLPGLVCDRAIWAPVIARLAGVECVVPDFSDSASLGEMAERVLAVAPSRFALAGHSMGGRVALEVMRRAPGRVARLALLDTGFRARSTGAPGDEEARGRYALLAIARERGMRAMGEAWSRPMVHPARLADGGLMEAILAMIERQSPERFAKQVEALLARPDAEGVLRAIDCPTLVLTGREDGWAPVAQHEEIAARVAGSELRVVARCGHMSPMERPGEVAEALQGWLARPVATLGEIPTPAQPVVSG